MQFSLPVSVPPMPPAPRAELQGIVVVPSQRRALRDKVRRSHRHSEEQAMKERKEERKKIEGWRELFRGWECGKKKMQSANLFAPNFLRILNCFPHFTRFEGKLESFCVQ
ncbi:uncharacterized protein LOC129312812 [Prosopis cineraria]|uniref:uncharacterized protein LOC129312812 n=1 Tax=Prosopis cineraria TaxID=364024 RepID=UPI00240FEA67|nr:uncharacterized protein LOC129312812 [Prosopis cineraria]